MSALKEWAWLYVLSVELVGVEYGTPRAPQMADAEKRKQ